MLSYVKYSWPAYVLHFKQQKKDLPKAEAKCLLEKNISKISRHCKNIAGDTVMLKLALLPHSKKILGFICLIFVCVFMQHPPSPCSGTERYKMYNDHSEGDAHFYPLNCFLSLCTYMLPKFTLHRVLCSALKVKENCSLDCFMKNTKLLPVRGMWVSASCREESELRLLP